MAMSSMRLRRAVTPTVRRLSGAAANSPVAPSSSSPSFHKPSSVQSQPRRPSEFLFFQSRAFRASPASLLSARGFDGGDEIGPDTILFEGCDYNHWLIVMDFPKDNRPSPEEMVRTYEETCAKGLNISVEEAKLKMYACSTTTYTGFQAVMTEEESEKFNGLPGVIFVLPDSYIDPQNKEYGGDKYMNGTIIPRPPPIQYGRQSGRYRDQPRYDRSTSRGPMPNQEMNPQYSQQGPGYGAPMPNQPGNPPHAPQFRPQQNYPPPQQNYQQPGAGIPYQQGRGSPPPQYQGTYNQGGQGNYNQGQPGNYNQGQPGNYNQGGPGNYNQGGPGNYNQGGPGNYYPRDQRAYPQGDQRNYGPPPSQQGGYTEDYGNYGQGTGGGDYQGQGGLGRN